MIKRILTSLLSIIFLCTILQVTGIRVYAEEVNVEQNKTTIKDEQGISYSLDNETKTADVSSTGDILGNITIPKEVVNNGQVYTVTSILRDGWFAHSSLITSISIPDSIKYIGIFVFLFSNKLTAITVDKNNSVYSSEDGVLFNKEKTKLIKYPSNKSGKSYVIPSSVSCVENAAFYESNNLNSIIIPNGINNLLKGTFRDCTNLTSIFIPSSINTIDDDTFDGCTNLSSIIVDENNQKYSSENGILFNKIKTKIIKYPMNKKDLSYIIPNSVLGISNDAFKGCPNLTTLTIPNSVTNIGTAAFKECTSLTSLVIPENITSLDTNLFKGCTNLKTITIPSKITNLTVDMFDGCVNLNSIIVDENNSKFKTEDGVLFDKGKTSIIVYPAQKTQSSYTVPDSVVSIGANSFLNCKDLSTIIIPRSVTSIEKGAFQGCTNLKSIIADNNIQYLSEDGVLYNKAKTNIIVYPSKKIEASYTIPGSVTVIGDNEFNGNSNLTNIVISSSISSIFKGAFIACNNLNTLNVVDDNMFYSSVDGILFNKEKTSLISYPVNKIEKSYTIPSGVTTIAIDAFKLNKNLTTINIPSNVTTIEGNPFLECTSLDKIVVDDNNNNFSSLDGVLFNKQKTEILAYPRNKAEKSYNIPTSVTNINSKAFYKCQNLSSVVIPNNVTNLEKHEFQGCTNLVSLTIPMNVTSIGKSIDNRCEYLNEFFIDENDRSIIEEYGEYKLVDTKSNYKYVSTDGVQFTKEKIDIVDTGDRGDTSLLLLTLALVLSLTGLICYNTKSDYTY